MYIALYDASKGPDQLETLKPWLTAIHARAKHCPVLIIGSHADRLPWYVSVSTSNFSGAYIVRYQAAKNQNLKADNQNRKPVKK